MYWAFWGIKLETTRLSPPLKERRHRVTSHFEDVSQNRPLKYRKSMSLLRAVTSYLVVFLGVQLLANEIIMRTKSLEPSNLSLSDA